MFHQSRNYYYSHAVGVSSPKEEPRPGGKTQDVLRHMLLIETSDNLDSGGG
jgi:hypothetical protein